MTPHRNYIGLRAEMAHIRAAREHIGRHDLCVLWIADSGASPAIKRLWNRVEVIAVGVNWGRGVAA